MKRKKAYVALIRGDLHFRDQNATPSLLLLREDGHWTLPHRNVEPGTERTELMQELQRIGLQGGGMAKLGPPVEHGAEQHECHVAWSNEEHGDNDAFAWIRADRLNDYPLASHCIPLLVFRALSVTEKPHVDVRVPISREAIPRILRGWNLHPTEEFKTSACGLYVYRSCGNRILVWQHYHGTPVGSGWKLQTSV